MVQNMKHLFLYDFSKDNNIFSLLKLQGFL